SQLIDLSLVEVSDRLHIREPVATLYEESLIVLQAIGSTHDRVMQPVAMEILDHFADPLLEVRGRDNLPILGTRQADSTLFSARRLHHDVGHVDQTAALAIVGQNQFAAPVVAEFGNDPADRVIAAAVAAGAFEDRGDVFSGALDTEL